MMSFANDSVASCRNNGRKAITPVAHSCQRGEKGEGGERESSVRIE